MKNIILIDDLSNKGWKSVLEKSVIKQEGVISAFSTFDCALKGLATKADLIFLDIRFKSIMLNCFKDLSKLLFIITWGLLGSSGLKSIPITYFFFRL